MLSFFKNVNDYSAPCETLFMIDFKAKDPDALFKKLKAEDAGIMQNTEAYEYDKFGKSMDRGE